jgi:hypothetical protein
LWQDLAMTFENIIAAKRARADAMGAAAAQDHLRSHTATLLAEALPRAIERGLQGQAADGELVVRFHTAMELSARRGLAGDEQLLGALFALMREQGVRAGQYLGEQGAVWRASAHRAEGAQAELLAVVAELGASTAGERPSCPDVAPGWGEAPQDGAEGDSPAVAPTSGDDAQTEDP